MEKKKFILKTSMGGMCDKNTALLSPKGPTAFQESIRQARAQVTVWGKHAQDE